MEERLYIEIDSIPAEGLKLTDDFTNEYIGLKDDDYVRFSDVLHVKTFTKKMLNVVVSEVEVQGEILSHCSRSFVEIKKPWKQHFIVEILIESDVRHVNIGDEIRQEVILRLPIKLLSDEEAAKERQDAIDDEPPDDGVYQPFADLKDID